MDLAPHVLKQISQTITTLLPLITYVTLSPSLSNPHPPSIVNTTLSFRLFGMTSSRVHLRTCMHNTLHPPSFTFTFAFALTFTLTHWQSCRDSQHSPACDHAHTSGAHVPRHWFSHALRVASCHTFLCHFWLTSSYWCHNAYIVPVTRPICGRCCITSYRIILHRITYAHFNV